MPVGMPKGRTAARHTKRCQKQSIQYRLSMQYCITRDSALHTLLRLGNCRRVIEYMSTPTKNASCAQTNIWANHWWASSHVCQLVRSPPVTFRGGGWMGEEPRAGACLELCFTFSKGVGSSSNLQLQHSSAVLPGTILATCCQKLRWLGLTVR